MLNRVLVHRLFPWSVLATCAAYAVIRYWGFDNVKVEQIPAYLGNKACSFAGLIVLAASRIVLDGDARRRLGLFGAGCVLVHVPLSLAIMNPKYFRDFYSDGWLSWQAEASMLAGSLALVPLAWLFAATDLAGLPSQRRPFVVPAGLGRTLLVLCVAHVALMGYGKWFTPKDWPGWMPPITMLSAGVAMAACFWPAGRRT